MEISNFELDRIDKLILQELQANARLSNQELADKVALSPSPCLRRVRRLEEQGYIRRYMAVLDSDKVGVGLLAYVTIRLNKLHRSMHSSLSDFAQDVQDWPEVVECFAMSGDMDYLLRIEVGSLADFSRFAMNTLMQHPAVIDMRSSFSMKKIKEYNGIRLA